MPARSGRADSTLMVFRSRYVGQGMREDLTIRNFADEPALCTIEIFVGSDFADLFAVKEGRAGTERENGELSTRVSAGRQAILEERRKAAEKTVGRRESDEPIPADRVPTITYTYRRGGVIRGVDIRFADPAVVSADLATFEVVVPPRGEWSTCIEVGPVIDGDPVRPRGTGAASRSTWPRPAERLAQWRRRVPQVETDSPGLKEVIARSNEDLGALRIFDPDYPERVVVAAGAPWFMTVFGRDSLLTAWMALLVDPDLARGVLQTLARFQGTDVDPRHDEEPGRILHEMRFGDAASLSLGGGSIYYGTADATPLFVMLLGEMRRWGVAREMVDELLPNAARAIEWIEQFGDADGDGYVEYQRATDRGLANQGWKDSWDGIRYGDGRVAEAPIALCEVQAYTYGAYLASAHFAFEVGRHRHLRPLPGQGGPAQGGVQPRLLAGGQGVVRRRARRRQAAHRLADLQHRPLPVDRDRRRGQGPPGGRGAGVAGHVQRLGGAHAAPGQRRLQPDQLPLRFGVAARHGHRGRRPGPLRLRRRRPEADLRPASTRPSPRAAGSPSCSAGSTAGSWPVPVGYPTSCSPQAWAAASPLLCLRTLLRLDPWIPYGKTWLCPNLPEWIGYLKVEGIPLAGSRVTIEVGTEVPGGVAVSGLPPEIELVREPRRPSTAV